MKIQIDLRKNAHENMAVYFEEAKKWRRKAEGAKKALGKVHDKKQKIEKKAERKKTGWVENFHHAFTKNGFLVVAGKNSKQNDLVVARQLKEGDFFFHAEIVGAPATILKCAGKAPSIEDMEQAAQIAASYSRAWKQGYPVVDVYAATPDQVSKYSQGESVGKGAFMISGERRWFKNTELKLYLKEKDGAVEVLPFSHTQKTEPAVLIQPGGTPKEQAAKTLAKRFCVREEEVLSVLPGDVEIG